MQRHRPRDACKFRIGLKAQHQPRARALGSGSRAVSRGGHNAAPAMRERAEPIAIPTWFAGA